MQLRIKNSFTEIKFNFLNEVNSREYYLKCISLWIKKSLSEKCSNFLENSIQGIYFFPLLFLKFPLIENIDYKYLLFSILYKLLKNYEVLMFQHINIDF